MSEIKAVAVLTTFQDLPSSYGLVPVVLNQMRTLVDKGYEVGFFVQNGFQEHVDVGDVPEGVELMPYIPFLHLVDYQDNVAEQKSRVDAKGKLVGGRPRTNFQKQVKVIEDALEPWLTEYPTVITHDIIFQSWFVPHNQAIRNIAERHPEIRWVHWLHSGPSTKPRNASYPTTLRYLPFPNSVLVSPNDSMKQKFAEMYDMPVSSVKTIYHTLDIVKWRNMDEFSVELIKKHKLLDCDGLIVWPTRIDHPEAKGMFKAIQLVAMMNRYANIKFMFLNSSSGSTQAKNNIQRMKAHAKKWGLPERNLIFTSEMDKKYEKGVSQEVVKNMYDIASATISGSLTETFSYGVLEAAAHKCMLILNEDLAVFKELVDDRGDYFKNGFDWGGQKDMVHYWGPERNCPEGHGVRDIIDKGGKKEFVCKVCGTTHPARENEQNYFREVSLKMLARLGLVDYTCEHCGERLGKIGAYNPLRQHRHIMRQFSPDWVWTHQLEPVLRGEW